MVISRDMHPEEGSKLECRTHRSGIIAQGIDQNRGVPFAVNTKETPILSSALRVLFSSQKRLGLELVFHVVCP